MKKVTAFIFLLSLFIAQIIVAQTAWNDSPLKSSSQPQLAFCTSQIGVYNIVVVGDDVYRTMDLKNHYKAGNISTVMPPVNQRNSIQRKLYAKGPNLYYKETYKKDNSESTDLISSKDNGKTWQKVNNQNLLHIIYGNATVGNMSGNAFFAITKDAKIYRSTDGVNFNYTNVDCIIPATATSLAYKHTGALLIAQNKLLVIANKVLFIKGFETKVVSESEISQTAIQHPQNENKLYDGKTAIILPNLNASGSYEAKRVGQSVSGTNPIVHDNKLFTISSNKIYYIDLGNASDNRSYQFDAPFKNTTVSSSNLYLFRGKLYSGSYSSAKVWNGSTFIDNNNGLSSSWKVYDHADGTLIQTNGINTNVQPVKKTVRRIKTN